MTSAGTARLKTLQPDQLTSSICVVLGTRPGIVKQSPLIRELSRRELPFFTLHTGQHYSPEMDAAFFSDLNLSVPKYRLTEPEDCHLHGEQTAAMLVGTERVLLDERPRLVLVGGDANTNLAAALAARKLHIAVGHVEAGLRSFDWRMPEEHNRVMIDHISDWLFAPGEHAVENLRREGVRGRVEVVGNTVVDAVLKHKGLAMEKSSVLADLGFKARQYLLVTLHREENVDDPLQLRLLLDAIIRAGSRHAMPVVFPAHPRTRLRLREFGLDETRLQPADLRVVDPLGYLDFLCLLASAGLVLTDSGGVQQEACIVKTPCVTLRRSTEWTETLPIGANMLAGDTPASIAEAVAQMLSVERNWINPFGDGNAAERIVDAVSLPPES